MKLEVVAQIDDSVWFSDVTDMNSDACDVAVVTSMANGETVYELVEQAINLLAYIGMVEADNLGLASEIERMGQFGPRR